jgi:hypothetical protein
MTIAKAQPIAAVVLLLSCVCVFVGGLALPVRNVFETQWHRITEAEQRLALVYSRRRDSDLLKNHRQTLESKISRDAGLIVAHSEADATQKFQQRSRRLMTDYNVEMGSMRSLPTSREGEIVIMRLEASMQVPIERAFGFIKALEASENSLFVERLQLRKDRALNVLAMAATLRAYAVVAPLPRPSQ